MHFDKHVPLPPMTKDKVEEFRSMEIGESFAKPKEEAQGWRVAMTRAAEGGDRYFISRTQKDGRVRFWRKA